MHNYIDFEKPIVELEQKIEGLSSVGYDEDLDITDEINKLKEKKQKLIEKIFSSLTAWQITQLARHPYRPYTLDYLHHIFTDFDELHGDRHFSDDQAIVGGIGRLDNQPIMLIGHQKGRTTKEKILHNFGSPRPEGYRKACRLMELAERFQIPVITFIDTPGAYPGMDSEERGMSEALAHNLAVMSRLKTPIISVVIGEGCSGGALGIGVCDQLLMLEYATYAVISPEGCASILFKTAERASEAAEIMGLTAHRLQELGFVDRIINEPPGGAHRDMNLTAQRIKDSLIEDLAFLKTYSVEELLDRRYQRLMAYGN